MSRGKKILGLIGWLVLSFVPSLAGAFFRPGAWYEQMDKPAWTPPDWVFGPVWALLYALMGVAAWLVWIEPSSPARRAAITIFIVQLMLNALWSPAFFGMRSPGLGLLVIVPLWLAIMAAIAAFWRVHRIAAGLLVPYLVWVSYAAALNLAIWQMN